MVNGELAEKGLDMALEGLNRLQVYKEAQKLVKVVYQRVIPALPPEEKWGLESQIRRAAISVPANIAEGYGRYYYQETIRFFYLSRGSLMELSSHMDVAVRQGFLSNEINQSVNEQMSQLLKLIHGYIRYLKQSKRGLNEPGNQKIAEEESLYLNDKNNADESL